MMSAAQRCNLPPRSGDWHLRAKVALPDGREPSLRRGLSHCGGQAERLGRARTCWRWTSPLDPCPRSQGTRSCRTKAGGSVSCISKLGAILVSLSPTYLRSLNRQQRVHQLSFLSQEQPGSLPLCLLPSSHPAYPVHMLSAAGIRAFPSAKSVPRKHSPAWSPHTNLAGLSFLAGFAFTGLGPQF